MPTPIISLPLDRGQLVQQVRLLRGIHNDGSNWCVGLTDDPERRLAEHQASGQYPDLRHFTYFVAFSESAGRAAESELLADGLYGGPGGEGWRYLYAFAFGPGFNW